ncbi:MAG: succinate dehydrogenase assembly factor 2 [Alphaproteobacteria bacterium]|nr:succinate dehydrogenase assembly factor 2 [Alphaproteobacteria bacterium]
MDDKEKQNIENKRKQLIFRSNHRGTKEMDLIMGGYASANVPDFTIDELQDYEFLLTQNDPDLYNWITDKEFPPEDIANLSVYQKLKAHKFV